MDLNNNNLLPFDVKNGAEDDDLVEVKLNDVPEKWQKIARSKSILDGPLPNVGFVDRGLYTYACESIGMKERNHQSFSVLLDMCKIYSNRYKLQEKYSNTKLHIMLAAFGAFNKITDELQIFGNLTRNVRMYKYHAKRRMWYTFAYHWWKFMFLLLSMLWFIFNYPTFWYKFLWLTCTILGFLIRFLGLMSPITFVLGNVYIFRIDILELIYSNEWYASLFDCYLYRIRTPQPVPLIDVMVHDTPYVIPPDGNPPDIPKPPNDDDPPPPPYKQLNRTDGYAAVRDALVSSKVVDYGLSPGMNVLQAAAMVRNIVDDDPWNLIPSSIANIVMDYLFSGDVPKFVNPFSHESILPVKTKIKHCLDLTGPTTVVSIVEDDVEQEVKTTEIDRGFMPAFSSPEPITFLSPVVTSKFDDSVYHMLKCNVGTQMNLFKDVSYVNPDVKKGNVVLFDKVEFQGKINDPMDGVKIKLLKKTKDSFIGKFCLLGMAYADIIPGVFANTLSNERASLLNRHLVANNNADIKLWHEAAEIAFPKFNFQPSHLMSETDWIKTQPSSKQLALSKCVLSNNDPDFFDEKWHMRNFFIKTELLFPELDKPLHLKAPRGISGLYYPEANLALGPFMKSFSESLVNSFKQPYPKIVYSSGADGFKIGQWVDEMIHNGYEILEDDFSKFDATQGKGAHACEMFFYNKFGLRNKEKNALSAQKYTFGRGKYHKYEVPYTRKSGDQNTSLGNSLINASVHAYALEKCGITDYYMVVIGDDNMMAIKKGVLNVKLITKMHGIIASFGLVPKLLVKDHPSYCSGEFMPIKLEGKETVVLVPNMIKFLTKQGWTHTPLGSNETIASRLKGNYLGFPTLKHHPVLRVLHQYYTQPPINATYGGLNPYNNFLYEDRNIATSEHITTWFLRRYKLDLNEINHLEKQLWQHLIKSQGQPSVFGSALFAKIRADEPI